MKKVFIVFATIIIAGTVYFFWPNKEVTRCGVIPSGENGKLIKSCGTCVCDRGIPSGFNTPTCIGGKILNCTQSAE